MLIALLGCDHGGTEESASDQDVVASAPMLPAGWLADPDGAAAAVPLASAGSTVTGSGDGVASRDGQAGAAAGEPGPAGTGAMGGMADAGESTGTVDAAGMGPDDGLAGEGLGGGGEGTATGDGGALAVDGEEATAGPLPEGRTAALSGRTLTLGGQPFHMRGVCYNPVAKGQTQDQGVDFAGAAPIDIPLMASAGVNTVRTYGALTDRAVLDALHAAGIYVLNSVYPYGGSPAESVLGPVRAVKDHPAILMWVIGNEWNYNGLYVGMSHDESLLRLNQVATLIREADPEHPIATVYGELPSEDTLARMPDVDVWGLNVYRGISFGSLFDDFAARSDKPYFIAEYGADAYNTNLPGEDLHSQAMATRALTQEIEDHAAAFHDGGTCAGGTLFEWSDEWWKDGAGSPAAQDVGGIAPGGGPYPDQTFNEEWWGVVDIDRNQRPALMALQEVFAEP